MAEIQDVDSWTVPRGGKTTDVKVIRLGKGRAYRVLVNGSDIGKSYTGLMQAWAAAKKLHAQSA